MQGLVEIQRDIYLTFADTIRAFAAGGGWFELATFLPMAIIFGAVHALTPGHSKAILATYLAGCLCRSRAASWSRLRCRSPMS